MELLVVINSLLRNEFRIRINLYIFTFPSSNHSEPTILNILDFYASQLYIELKSISLL